MKIKKLVVLTLALSLFGGTVLFADSAAQKVRVFVNGIESKESGLLSEGSTYLPLRQIASSLQALVVWDDSAKRASIYKPNVHMFLFQGQNSFGNVKQGRVTFSVFSQIDNLKVDINGVKVAIADPSGDEKMIQSQDVNPNKQSDNFWFRTEDFRYNFDSAGKYLVRFYIKPVSSNEWTLVSEKTITAQ
ncbi:stalk domain-containing protein [Paenibacillus pinihumi]|uniref:stalk domain-containing protein n=1 Tax=Paenibacillus pinihumi TaxID=669462 RepID=UPI0003F68573|nr:stalk domain-containing protein [Paenibacillus pinihumi]